MKRMKRKRKRKSSLWNVKLKNEAKQRRKVNSMRA